VNCKCEDIGLEIDMARWNLICRGALHLSNLLWEHESHREFSTMVGRKNNVTAPKVHKTSKPEGAQTKGEARGSANRKLATRHDANSLETLQPWA